MKIERTIMKIEYMFLFLIYVIPFVIYGCFQEKSQTSQYLISEGSFFSITNDACCSDFDALKISSQNELETFTNQCNHEKILMYLKDLTNLTFTASFIYITRDSLLQEISVVPRMNVRAARLEKSDNSGLGIYIVIGDLSSVIKPTAY